MVPSLVFSIDQSAVPQTIEWARIQAEQRLLSSITPCPLRQLKTSMLN